MRANNEIEILNRFPLQKVDFNKNHNQWLNVNSSFFNIAFPKTNMLATDSLNIETIKIASSLQLY